MHTRRTTPASNLWLLALLLTIAGLSSGCEQESAPAPEPKQKIGVVGRLLGEIARQNQDRLPASESEFESAVAALPEGLRTSYGVEPNKIAEFMTSERDGQPFLIRWGEPTAASKEFAIGGANAIVAEAQGVSGKRLVANSFGMSEEWDDEKVERAFN